MGYKVTIEAEEELHVAVTKGVVQPVSQNRLPEITEVVRPKVKPRKKAAAKTLAVIKVPAANRWDKLIASLTPQARKILKIIGAEKGGITEGGLCRALGADDLRGVFGGLGRVARGVGLKLNAVVTKGPGRGKSKHTYSLTAETATAAAGWPGN